MLLSEPLFQLFELSCPLGIFLLLLCPLIAYLLFFRRSKGRKPNLKSLHLQDFTLDELRLYDGNGPEGRILVAVNGKVFDVTNNGQQFYGKNAPYRSFAGKDISRALACFDAELPEKDGGYDDLSDLSQSEMDRLLEWELQFLERYVYVGRLLRPGEPHHVYDPKNDLQSGILAQCRDRKRLT